MSAMGLGRFLYTPLLPIMQTDLGFGSDIAGWLAGANYAGYLLGALLASVIGMGRQQWNWNATGLLLCAGATLATGLLDTVVLIAVARFLAGIGSALVLVLCAALVFEALGNRNNPRVAGVIVAGIGLGIALSGGLTLGLKSLFSASELWLIGGTVMLILALAALKWVPRPQKPPETAPSGTPPLSWWRNRPFVLLTVSYFLAGLGYVVSATFLVALLQTGTGQDWIGDSAWILVGLAAVPSTWGWGRLAHRFDGHTALAAAFVLLTLSITLPILSTTPALSFLSAALFGGTFLGIVAISIAVGAALLPHARTQAIGILTVAFSLGQMIGPVLAGEATALTGSFSLALTGAAVASAGGFVFILLSGAANRSR